MPGYAVLQDNIPSSSSDNTYQVRRGGDGVLYCTCRGWVVSKNSKARSRTEPAACTHTKKYVAAHPGTKYGPPGMFASEGSQTAPVAMTYAKKSAPVGKKLPANVAAAVTNKPAAANWRDVLLAEQKAATARGVATPAAALSAYSAEVAQFAYLDVEGAEAGTVAPDAAQFENLDVD